MELMNCVAREMGKGAYVEIIRDDYTGKIDMLNMLKSLITYESKIENFNMICIDGPIEYKSKDGDNDNDNVNDNEITVIPCVSCDTLYDIYIEMGELFETDCTLEIKLGATQCLLAYEKIGPGKYRLIQPSLYNHLHINSKTVLYIKSSCPINKNNLKIYGKHCMFTTAMRVKIAWYKDKHESIDLLNINDICGF
jgi:hypothetical protein